MITLTIEQAQQIEEAFESCFCYDQNDRRYLPSAAKEGLAIIRAARAQADQNLNWGNNKFMLNERAQEQVKQELVAVTDGMVYAFHNAITDGSIGEADFQEIKTGLTASLVDYVSTKQKVEHKWPMMGYGNVAIGGARQPDGMSALLYMNMDETRDIGADTTDLFPVGSAADPSKLMACIFFKDEAAIQQTIDVLREMQIELNSKAIRADIIDKAIDMVAFYGGPVDLEAAIRGLND